MSAFLGLPLNLQPQKKSTLQTFIAEKIDFASSNGRITRLKDIGKCSQSLAQKRQFVFNVLAKRLFFVEGTGLASRRARRLVGLVVINGSL